MVTLRHSLAIVLCLLYVPHIAVAFLRRSGLNKRFGQVPGSRAGPAQGGKLFFKGELFKPRTVGVRHGSIVLECQVGGTPTPTIHWLKNGERITQGTSHNSRDDEASYEDHNVIGGRRVMRLSSTRSRLFLDCLSEDDEAEYTCVAETALTRKSQSTVLTVEKPDNVMYSEIHECIGKRSDKGEPARIYMWTSSRLEFEDTKVQLFCRAEGTPQPTIVWYDRDNKPITDSEHYRIAKNGDLIIRDVSWYEDMGVYTCEADNGYGSDTAEAFLYPTPRDDDFGFPL